ncbi:hypothetical protein V8C86DRAFT_3023847 [Haematococcus lacustris]
MLLKLYVHHDSEPSFTKVIKCQADASIADLVVAFLTAYNAKYSHSAINDVTDCQVHTSVGKPALLSQRASALFSSGADVFITRVSNTSQQRPDAAAIQAEAAVPAVTSTPACGLPSKPCTPANTNLHPQPQPPCQKLTKAGLQPGTAAAAASVPSSPAPTSKGSEATATAPKLVSSAVQDLGPWQQQLAPYLDRAEQAAKVANYRAAGEIYDKVLEVVPGVADVVQRAACMWANAAHQPQRALPLAQRLVQLQPASSAAHQLLGSVQLALGKPDAALVSFDTALDLAKRSSASAAHCLDLQASMARALFQHTGQAAMQDAAASLVMAVLKQDEGHWEALRLYAELAEQRGLLADAIKVALRLLVARSSHQGVRALLARCLQAPEGMSTLLTELLPLPASTLAPASAAGSAPDAGTANSASAYAFLATCVKDHSAVQPTVQLLRLAVAAVPVHMAYALNLAHALELLQDSAGVVAVAAQAFRRAAATPALALGPCLLQAVAEELESLPPLPPGQASLAWRQAAPWVPPCPTPPSSTPSSTAPRPAASTPAAAAAAPTPTHAVAARKDGSKVSYSSNQLDLLALGFTAVKIVYVAGGLPFAARLVALLEPARQASAKELHTTLIRNEAAYFGSQLVLVLGEIDCREGLLLAVQKCKYGTLDEAMTATIDIYIALLTDLIASREFEIFVHPVPAVLNETRAVVRPFTAMLKQRVEAAARAKPALSRLHYLDFADALLTPDGAKLDPALAFDGTHLAPSYVRHLARELARVT